MSFLYKNLTKKDIEDIKKSVERILNSFSKSLGEIGKLPLGGSIERDASVREEKKDVHEGDKAFREKILKNAPNKTKDFIVSEKKTW